jgi:hypothetical protein
LIGMKGHQLLLKPVRFFRIGVHMKFRWLFRILDDTINLTAGEKLFGKCNFWHLYCSMLHSGKILPILKRKGNGKFLASKSDGASMTFVLNFFWKHQKELLLILLFKMRY